MDVGPWCAVPKPAHLLQLPAVDLPPASFIHTGNVIFALSRGIPDHLGAGAELAMLKGPAKATTPNLLSVPDPNLFAGKPAAAGRSCGQQLLRCFTGSDFSGNEGTAAVNFHRCYRASLGLAATHGDTGRCDCFSGASRSRGVKLPKVLENNSSRRIITSDRSLVIGGETVSITPVQISVGEGHL